MLAEAVSKLRAERSEIERSETQHSETEQARPVTFLLAASSTKDLPTLLTPLLRPNDRILTVEFGAVEGMPWVQAMDSLAVLEGARAILSEMGSVVGSQDGEAFGKNLPAALKRASEIADEGPLVVAGSLYLVGDVLRVLREVGGGEA